MLVFSHGYGGSGIGSAFFTEALAARGWIVAAPDHNDSYSAVRIRSGQVEKSNRRDLYYAQAITISDPEDRDKYLYRLDEMSYVINRMVLSEEFRGVIDKNRIAVGGHSFGGYTALGLCGTIQERQDSRIKAVLLFSTGAGAYLFTEDELKAVRIPLMLFIGERERYQSRGAKTMAELGDKIYRNVSAPKYFLEIKGANHFSFNNRFEDSRVALLLSGSERQFDVIRRYSIAFLEKHVAGEKGFDRVLEQKHPLITRYLKKE
jgi:predicted dienelactone hydrolase